MKKLSIKKILAAALVACMVCALCACKKDVDYADYVDDYVGIDISGVVSADEASVVNANFSKNENANIKLKVNSGSESQVLNAFKSVYGTSVVDEESMNVTIMSNNAFTSEINTGTLVAMFEDSRQTENSTTRKVNIYIVESGGSYYIYFMG